MISPAVRTIYDATMAEFPTLTSLGIYNRRPIAGSTTWSQHAWGNAWDIAPPVAEKPSTQATPSPTLDRVAQWLKTQKSFETLPIVNILWRRTAHWDHIHVDGDPKMTGTPPITTPVGIGDGDMLEYFIDLQEMLNELGYTDMDGEPLRADGVYGPKTRFADKASRAPSVSEHHTHLVGPHTHKINAIVT